MNVRFNAGNVQRAPVFRTFAGTITPNTPVFVYGLYNQGGFDSLLYVSQLGLIYQYTASVETNVTEVGHVANSSTSPMTACNLSSCTYINRPDGVPRVLTPGAAGGLFVPLANWTSTWRCASLRSFKSHLVALNMTEGASSFPLRVRCSDIALENAVPATWDETDTTKLAVRNSLSQARTPIVDGGALGDVFIIYTRDEAWKMYEVGGQFIYDFQRLPFDNAGLINQNCYVEIDGKHYAWSDTDIYLHDGVSKQSVIDQRNRETFFKRLNMSKANVFFVAHDKQHNEIIFCGSSISALVSVPGAASFCNYGAVYNYRNNTWSFRDLPNVSASTTANANTAYTWTTIPGTWGTIGGSWADMEDSFSRWCMFSLVADATNGPISTSKIDVLDFADVGKLTLPLDSDSAVNPAAYVTRLALPLDMEGAPRRAYKQVNALMPSANIQSSDTPLTVYFGTHAESGGLGSTIWDAGQSFDPRTQYKLDTRVAGRYISLKFVMLSADYFTLSAYDLDLTITGRR
jgi:hypothetical protein